MAASFYSKQQTSGAPTAEESGGGRVSTLQDVHHRGAWSMQIPAGPPVSGSTCERALPAPERRKQEAAPEYHIPVFSNSKPGQQVQEQQPKPSWPTAAHPARAPKDKDKKAQPLKDGLKDIKEKTFHVLFGKQSTTGNLKKQQ